MINYIKGKYVYAGTDYILIENNGIGYHINVSVNTIAMAGSVGEDITVYTYMCVKEDDISLYGFLSAEELDMFNILIGVSGVGPKSATTLLGSASPSQLTLAILTDDYTVLSNAPGIGKKTAQRIALELKDKFKSVDTASMARAANIPAEAVNTAPSARADAIAGLVAWGYSSAEATKAVDVIYEARLDAAQLISRALKVIK